MIPKHEPSKRTKGSKKNQLATANDLGPAFVDMTPIAEAIDHFASIFSTYVTQARNGDNTASLYTDPNGYPVKVRLITSDECDVFDGIVGTLEEQGDKQAAVLERIATAFERIANAMTKQPG